MGQKFFASDSVNSMLVATSSFLSALILSRKICILSAGLSCAQPDADPANNPTTTSRYDTVHPNCFFHHVQNLPSPSEFNIHCLIAICPLFVVRVRNTLD